MSRRTTDDSSIRNPAQDPVRGARAHPELRPAQVHHEALHASTVGMRQFALDDFATGKFRPFITTRPVLCTVLDHQIEFAGLECFQPRDIVLVKTVVDASEIECSFSRRHIPAPVIRIQFVADRAAGIVTINQIRAADDRR